MSFKKNIFLFMVFTLSFILGRFYKSPNPELNTIEKNLYATNVSKLIEKNNKVSLATEKNGNKKAGPESDVEMLEFLSDFSNEIKNYKGDKAKKLMSIEKSYLKLKDTDPYRLFEAVLEGARGSRENPNHYSYLLKKLIGITKMKEQAKEELLQELENNLPQKHIEEADIKTIEDEYWFHYQRPDEIAYTEAYKSYLTLADESEAFESTLELIEVNENVLVQRSITSLYVDKSPHKGYILGEQLGIEKSNELLPHNYEAFYNEAGEFEIIDHIEPIRKRD